MRLRRPMMVSLGWLLVLASSAPALSQPSATQDADADQGDNLETTAEATADLPEPTSEGSEATTTAVAETAPVKLRRGAPPPPKPSEQQLRAYEMLRQEADEYTEGAKEFRRSLTMIVRHHYEERRRRILSRLDQEVGLEREALDEARDGAIAQLESFIEKYSGPNAHPEATPDAMFRLAALYEERGRMKLDGDLATELEPAIDLYRRIIRDFPRYEEIAAVHYYLGHAMTDSGRLDEGQQAWRALACTNKFSVGPDPDEPNMLMLQPLEQDHDQKFWAQWYNRHPLPLDQAVQGRRQAGIPDDEIEFKNPYEGCEPIAQKVEPGDVPRYLPEVWWQLGNYHFDQIDPGGGPYNLNRAASAYERSMEYKKPPLYGVAMYKRAWTYFKQQRYRTAVEWFVNLLHYADEQEERTGDPGADFRTEAYTYIAGSLTYVDFDGPPPEHPYIPRNDVLDTELDPLKAEEKMAIAIERVQNPELIPQDKKWTVEIYKALAQEFIEITQNRNAIATLELTLEKFPLDRDAPVMQNKVAELYDQLARLAPEGSAAKEEYASKALSARTKLAAYVGTTPWTNANREDPEALQQAEQLVREGLKRAAADHTNYARGYYNKALELSDEAEQRALIEKSIREYELAATGWEAYLGQDPTALDAYDSRFWLADARYWIVVLQVALGRSPTDTEVLAAREAAKAARDSNEDDRFLQPAAFYVVSIADKMLEDAHRRYEESNGREGVEPREEVRFIGSREEGKVKKDPLPQQVQEAIQARDAYNARIPIDQDPERNGLLYAFQTGDWNFVYGQFEQARERFQPLYDQYCGKNEWGYKAWEKLISMSNFEGNAQRSRELAEGKSCAYDEETKIAEESLRKPVIQGVAYLDARKLYEEAEKMPPGPERDKKWREAAAAYKVALDAAPDRDEAPEAAMNGAYAYKQVGEYDKAIEMYELFISRYGDSETLTKLQKGDPGAEPPVAADPQKYEERVKFLKSAYDALAGAYVLFFDYPQAAATFDRIGDNEHFAQQERRDAARQALSLYSSLGDTTGMNRARERFRKLGASPEEMAEADYIVASSELKRWDELSPPEGENNTARRRAMSAMESYYTLHRNRPAAAKYVVRSAYWVAKAHDAVNSGDTHGWWRKTISAYDRYAERAPRKEGSSAATGSEEASMAAEAEYTMLDERLKRNYDYDTGHHRYKGTPVGVMEKYRKDALEAKEYYDELQEIVDKYVSPKWTTVAVARQGSVYDSLRTGLYNTRPPALIMFDPKQEALLKKAETSDNLDLQEKADAVRIKVQQAWRDARDKELDAADQIMVDRYATAVVLARRYNVSAPEVTRAIRRLAFFTDIIGEAKMQQYTSEVSDLNYQPGMFTKMRPGLVAAPEPGGLPEPLPVQP